MNMRILREWKKFENQVLDPRAGPVQRAEMRSAFIAGAFSALELLDPAKSPRQAARGMPAALPGAGGAHRG
jgi:hypothetical protein